MGVNTCPVKMTNDELHYILDHLDPSQIWVGLTPHRTSGSSHEVDLAGKEHVDMEIGEYSLSPFILEKLHPVSEAVCLEPFLVALASLTYSIPSSLVLEVWEHHEQVTLDILGPITEGLGVSIRQKEGSFGFEHLGINHDEQHLSHVTKHEEPSYVAASRCFEGITHLIPPSEEVKSFNSDDTPKAEGNSHDRTTLRTGKKKHKCTKSRELKRDLVFGEGIRMEKMEHTSQTVLVERV